MNRVWVRFGPPLVALRGVVGSRALRRTSIAFLIFSGAEAATWIAILVFAFDRGGPATTGLVGFLLLLPAGVIAPVAAALGDRRRRERVLGYGYVAQAIATGLTGAAIVLGAPDVAVYAAAVVAMAAMTTSRPAHHSLMPSLAATPDEVAAANSVSSMGDGLGGTLGTLAVTVLLAVAGTGPVYLVAAVLLGVSAAAVLTLGAHTPPSDPGPLRPWSLLAEAAHGFASIARARGPRLLVWIAALMTIAWGAFDVLLVSVAIEVLDLGEAGVGALQTAAGIGALVGAAGSVALVGGRRLWVAMVGAILLLAAGIAGSGASAVPAVVTAAVVAGGAITVLDVVGRTLLQRVVDDAVLTRVFGVVEALWMAGVGLGAGIAGVLTGMVGISTALLVIGVSLVVLTVPVIGGLRRTDRAAAVPERQFRLLRSLAMFAPLSPTGLERLASQLDRLATPSGSDVVVQGETGDRFYVIDSGSFDVIVDGRVLRRLREGDAFGEIALLHDVPRTATVRATDDGAVWTLDQEEFLATVTGQPQVSSAAHAISAERLRDIGHEGAR
ncbi:MAG: cyclic nucleotide-binding domain-containing protein [Actinomycetota bacterium]